MNPGARLDDAQESVVSQSSGAALVSEDGQSRFTLEILAWETALLPCTRYDEWLVVRLTLHTPKISRETEGAFLLRFEIEEILHAARQATTSAFRFESDFLEPVLTFRLSKAKDNPSAQAHIILCPPDAPASECPVAGFPLSDKNLATFAERLAGQLEGFPSRL